MVPDSPLTRGGGGGPFSHSPESLNHLIFESALESLQNRGFLICATAGLLARQTQMWCRTEFAPESFSLPSRFQCNSRYHG
jgi:hypothetical protein